MNAPVKRRAKKEVSDGVADVLSTFNNIHISITNLGGDVITRATGGMVGFKGARKSTPFAAQLASDKAAKEAMENYKLKRVAVCVAGPGAGRESAIRALKSAGLEITKITDVTRLPHNGCRPRKKRRV
jgi:small subunit ribosomal protein S11